ncbi:MAG TPA: hypothetical protein VLN26_03435, partial [Gaiellaceae bacterium]|nr:hypothetical protein [Gaiellaceae bacterium]
MRPAARDDLELLVAWWRAFAEATRADPGDAYARAEVEHRLSAASAGLRIWEDGGPVSFAAFGGPTSNGIRIGPVYTPPELRGRGYATALS